MKESTEQRTLIVAGMHRSLTSIVTESLDASGLFIGHDLIPGNAYNAHGHFESKAIVDFHLAVIQQKQLSSWWHLIDAHKAFAFAGTETFNREARLLLEQHFNYQFYGWKDPRSAFFLEGWDKILPDAHYIFVVRHPVQCVYSLMRRSLRSKIIKFRPLLALRYFNLWDATNKCLLEFYKNHSDKCIVIHTPEDLMSDLKISRINEMLRNSWNLPLTEVYFQSFFDSKLVQRKNPPLYLSWLFRIRRRTNVLYKEMLDRTF